MSNTAGKPLKGSEKLARLRLAKSEHVGAITFRQLVGRYGTAAKALEALPDLAARGGLRKAIKVCAKSEAEKILEEIEDLDAFLIFLGDEVYPAALGALEDAPPFLVGKGHAHLLGKKTIAIVGARNASANGQRFSFELAKTLGEQNYIIASGLARGLMPTPIWVRLRAAPLLCSAVALIFSIPRKTGSCKTKLVKTAWC